MVQLYPQTPAHVRELRGEDVPDSPREMDRAVEGLTRRGQTGTPATGQKNGPIKDRIVSSEKREAIERLFEDRPQLAECGRLSDVTPRDTVKISETKRPSRRTNVVLDAVDDSEVLHADYSHGARALAAVVCGLEVDRREGGTSGAS